MPLRTTFKIKSSFIFFLSAMFFDRLSLFSGFEGAHLGSHFGVGSLGFGVVDGGVHLLGVLVRLLLALASLRGSGMSGVFGFFQALPSGLVPAVLLALGFLLRIVSERLGTRFDGHFGDSRHFSS